MEGLHVMYYVIKTSVVLKISPLMVSNFCCEILCSLRRVAVAPLSQLIFQNRSGTPWRGLVCIHFGGIPGPLTVEFLVFRLNAV